MTTTLHAGQATGADQDEELEALDAAANIPFPIARASGLYTYSRLFPQPLPPVPVPAHPDGSPHRMSAAHQQGSAPMEAAMEWGGVEAGDGMDMAAAGPRIPLLQSAELRLDVDGDYPQMTASGTGYSRFTVRDHWIASLLPTETGWSGDIWYKDGTPGIPYSTVSIRVVRPQFFRRPTLAVVTFDGGAAPMTRVYRWTSARFRTVEFEYDSTSDSNQVTSVMTHAHPNRPTTLRNETLSIDTVYRRAGFTVTNTGGDGSVPLTIAGANGTWSDNEMHDAMQTFWSRFSNAPRWSMWVFSAALHDMGTSLGGIMFDDIGPNHRQGTAVFTEAFISTPPSGDAAPDAWVRRMRFWTTAHEMGHAFNLAHSWQKSLGTQWIALTDEPEARSFMNYPYNVTGGETAFFRTFDYRFSDAELLFMRHAPARFVQMGNADWFDHHGFESPADAVQASEYRLEVRANRERALFEFLEPVVLELKLTNTARDPKIVRATTLTPQSLVVIIKPQGKQARQWIPYATACFEPRAEVLEAGAAVYESLPIFAGQNGWDVAEPGAYTIQVAAEVEGVVVFSDPLQLRVASPRSFEEEALAGDFFSEDVGRTLAFSGSAVLTRANDTLRETVDRLPSSRAATHAAVALAQPLARDFKQVNIPETSDQLTSVTDAGGSVETRDADPGQAIEILGSTVSGQQGEEAAETLGHVRYRRQVEGFAVALNQAGAEDEAASLQSSLAEVLAARQVLPAVVREVKERAAAFGPAHARASKKSKTGADTGHGKK